MIEENRLPALLGWFNMPYSERFAIKVWVNCLRPNDEFPFCILEPFVYLDMKTESLC